MFIWNLNIKYLTLIILEIFCYQTKFMFLKEEQT